MNKPEAGDRMKEMVPENLHHGLALYVLCGLPTGSFLASVLAGDLFSAVRRADDTSLAALGSIVRFLCHHAPEECSGYEVRRTDWIRRGGVLRLEPAV